MKMNDLYTVDFLRLLPPSLKNDPTMLALAEIVSEQAQKAAGNIEKNIIYARIDELDEQTLDILAYDLHVDWYDYDYPLAVKRATIKDSIKVHRQLGTPFAVETALGNVFPGTRIEEWFEYGGEPYRFRVIIGATTSGVTADKQAAVMERIKFYKNLRSHLDGIRYKIEQNALVNVGAYCAFGQRIEIYPYLAHSIESGGSVYSGAVTQITRSLEISASDKFII